MFQSLCSSSNPAKVNFAFCSSDFIIKDKKHTNVDWSKCYKRSGEMPHTCPDLVPSDSNTSDNAIGLKQQLLQWTTSVVWKKETSGHSQKVLPDIHMYMCVDTWFTLTQRKPLNCREFQNLRKLPVSLIVRE